jgi:hypothetical protein
MAVIIDLSEECDDGRVNVGDATRIPLCFVHRQVPRTTDYNSIGAAEAAPMSH